MECSQGPITSSPIFAIHQSASLLTTLVLARLLKTICRFDMAFFQAFFTSQRQNLFLPQQCFMLFFNTSFSFATYFSYALREISYFFCRSFAKSPICFSSLFIMPTLSSIQMKQFIFSKDSSLFISNNFIYYLIQKEYVIITQNSKTSLYQPMNSNTIPHPPNASWMPPIDPNDQDTLQQEQANIEQQFKNILSQDVMTGVGTFETREEEQQQEEQDEEGDDIDYADEIQMPDVQQI